ncbi:MAG: hypothetical protein JSW43_01775 [Gemmatimonadota bacterium]|nr:MAG: hypothetical protein JSW43_01775 [Gemmatimonadota bacterium]
MKQSAVRKNRAGGVKAGLLVFVLVAVALTYCGFEFLGPYWRRYKLEEAAVQALGFAGQATDEAIRDRLLDDIAGMDLPPQASQINFVHIPNPRALQVTISYAETANLLITTVELPMSVEVRRAF